MKGHKFICAGLTTWDYIARSELEMGIGDDLPGQIDIKPGGVAVNIAIAITKQLNPKPNEGIVLLSATGDDKNSVSLLDEIRKLGVNCDYLRKQPGTCDSYVAIESGGILHGAIAENHQLDKAGTEIFTPLSNGQLANLEKPFTGTLIIDGNLSVKTLQYISESKVFDKAHIVVAAASPIKAKKLLRILKVRQCSIYLNLKEANTMTKNEFLNSSEAANFLFNEGAMRAIVTNGEYYASSRCEKGLYTIVPSKIELRINTGAGDIFLASHLMSTFFNADLCPQKHLAFAEKTVRSEIAQSF
ncbi:MAG: PfkB family carbohydrate kinase [Pseudomonadota bacterium]|nr:PfkB family carbohydrate kinase [Pseudomonadota bacterium]